ncbi:MAG: hypothetical protein JWN78_1129 [Bacteroidota bacterium]|nr:hypothetical protein [Bacteroidota bacterium]
MEKTKKNTGTKKRATSSGKSSTAKKSSTKKTNGSQNGHEQRNGENKKSKGIAGLISNIMHPSRTERSLDELFEKGLNDVYSAEKQLIKALPEMEKAAENETLRKAFATHLRQTKRHAERLEKIFEKMDIGKTGETCKAMEGLIEEGNKIIAEFQESPVRDSALIIAAQKVEHYEMASYGSLAELADVLGYRQAKNLLGTTLEEEEQTDELLTDIAMDINDEACEFSMSMEEESNKR